MCKKNTFFRVVTHLSLINGVYSGDYRLTDLAKHGHFGLGILSDINGEMVAFESFSYKIKADKTLCDIDSNDVTPFANVDFFKSSQQMMVSNVQNYIQLTQTLERQLSNKNTPHALRFDTQCDYVNFSIVRGQKKPYPPIPEVQKNKIVSTLERGSDTIIRFWIPHYWALVANANLN